jgi:hypothetical protein
LGAATLSYWKQLGWWAKGVLALYATSLLSSGAAFLIGAKQAGTWLRMPALILAAWAFFGHLITLDEDAPGGWSNPKGEGAIWRSSRIELLVKLACFLAIALLLLTQAEMPTVR